MGLMPRISIVVVDNMMTSIPLDSHNSCASNNHHLNLHTEFEFQL